MVITRYWCRFGLFLGLYHIGRACILLVTGWAQFQTPLQELVVGLGHLVIFGAVSGLVYLGRRAAR